MGGPLILVADDQAGVRRLIQEVLAGASLRVALAANGEEALALARQTRPDLALLDVKMPLLDGLETLRALKAQWPELPVIMMTAVGDVDRISEATALGARLTVTKPFDVFALRGLVLETLGAAGAGHLSGAGH